MKPRGALVGAVLVLAAGCGPRTTPDDSTPSKSSGGSSSVVGSSSRASSGGGSTTRPGSSSAGSGGSSAVSNPSSAASNASSAVSNASSALSHASSAVSSGSSVVSNGSSAVSNVSSGVGNDSSVVGTSAAGSSSVGGGSTSVGGGSSSVGGSSTGGGGAVCGNGVVEGSETCDDLNIMAGDGCSSSCAEELGWNCGGAPSACTTFCGDGITAGSEQCDDLGQTAGDGCDGRCATEMGFLCAGEPSMCAPICGDGVVLGTETCDDMGVISGDGCSSQCSPEAGFTCGTTVPTTCTNICGDGLVVTGELCDDQNAVGLDGCTSCVLDMGYSCTGAPSTCTAVCGDGLILGTEECDDGNTVNGDGCTTCMVDRLAEAEPNNIRATADGPFGVNGPYVSAAINPAGDVDVFAFTVTGVADLHIETFDGTTLACDAIDTFMDFIGADGFSILASNDDGGIDACSLLDSSTSTVLRRVPPGTYFVRVRASSAAGTIPAYTVRVSYTQCGNGVQTGTELCDDGNTVNGDGCDNNCTPTGCPNGIQTGAEVCDDGNPANGDGCSTTCVNEPGHLFEAEPNDDGTPAARTFDFLAANANGPITTSVIIHGGIHPVGDDDVFAITNTLMTPVLLRLDVYNPVLGLGVACEATIDTELDVRNAAGFPLAHNDDRRARELCSGVSFTMTPGQTVYAHLIEHGDDGPIPAYLLRVALTVCGNGIVEFGEECDGGASCDALCQRIPVCGDTFVDAPETCDDGNTTSGDSCSSTCQFEVITMLEVEPNGSAGTAVSLGTLGPGPSTLEISAALTPASDNDWFAFTVTAPMTLLAYTYSTAGQFLTSCGAMDTVMWLYNGVPANLTAMATAEEATIVQYDDDDGLEACSLIGGTDVVPVRQALVPGTYYLRVQLFGSSGTAPSYLLGVSLAP